MKRAIGLLAALLVVLIASYFVTQMELSRREEEVPALASASPADSLSPVPTVTPLPVDDITFDVYYQGQILVSCPEDAPVLEAVYRQTGVRIHRRSSPDGSDTELLTLLASDQLPDAIVFQSAELLKRFREENALLPLNDLVLNHCRQVVEVNWAQIAGRLPADDGLLWTLPSLYAMDAAWLYPETDLGITCSVETFAEAPASIDDCFRVLRTNSSAAVLPLEGEDGMQTLAQWIAGANGLSYSDGAVRLSDGRAACLGACDAFWDTLQELNGYWREGLLLIPETESGAIRLAAEGEVSAYIGHGWEVASALAEDAENGRGMHWAPSFPTRGGKASYAMYTFGSTESGIAVTKSCVSPERFVQFYGWANSECGHIALMGIADYMFSGSNAASATKGTDFIITEKSALFPGRRYVEKSGWYLENEDDESFLTRRGNFVLSAFSYALRANYPDGLYDCIGTDAVGEEWTDALWEAYGRFGLTSETYAASMRAVSRDISDIEGLPQNGEIWKLTCEAMRQCLFAESEETFSALETEYREKLDALGIVQASASLEEEHAERLRRWAKGIQPLSSVGQ